MIQKDHYIENTKNIQNYYGLNILFAIKVEIVVTELEEEEDDISSQPVSPFQVISEVRRQHLI